MRPNCGHYCMMNFRENFDGWSIVVSTRLIKSGSSGITPLTILFLNPNHPYIQNSNQCHDRLGATKMSSSLLVSRNIALDLQSVSFSAVLGYYFLIGSYFKQFIIQSHWEVYLRLDKVITFINVLLEIAHCCKKTSLVPKKKILKVFRPKISNICMWVIKIVLSSSNFQ